MVERIHLERRKHVRDFKKEGAELVGGYHSISFSPDDPHLERVLERLKKLPQYDESSFVVSNLSNSGGKEIVTVFTPPGCPDIYPERQTVIPKAGETYLVVGYDRMYPNRIHTAAVLVDNDVSALKIGKRVISEALGCFRRDVDAEVDAVGLTDFINAVKVNIDEGHSVSDALMGVPEIREYFFEHSKNSGKPGS